MIKISPKPYVSWPLYACSHSARSMWKKSSLPSTFDWPLCLLVVSTLPCRPPPIINPAATPNATCRITATAPKPRRLPPGSKTWAMYSLPNGTWKRQSKPIRGPLIYCTNNKSKKPLIVHIIEFMTITTTKRTSCCTP